LAQIYSQLRVREESMAKLRALKSHYDKLRTETKRKMHRLSELEIEAEAAHHSAGKQELWFDKAKALIGQVR
jgi:hypothetical protein